MAINKSFFIQVIAISICTSLTACNVNIQVEKPGDELATVCQKNSLAGIEVLCKEGHKQLVVTEVNPKKGAFYKVKKEWVDVPTKPSPLPGLVVFSEVGTKEANERLANSQGGQNPLADMLGGKGITDPIAKEMMDTLAPHLRTMANNLFVGFMERTIQSYGKKYGRIYIVRGDTQLKDDFLGAIKLAVKNHPQVDIFAMGHGAPGLWNMNKELSHYGDLTSTELVKFAQNQLSGSERNKVRAVFNTQCFMAMPPSMSEPSMLEAFTQAFPNVNAYGSLMINFMFFHRDWIMFEKFYESGDFKLAYLTATASMNKNIATNKERDSISFPAMSGKGCVKLGPFKKCKTENYLVPATDIFLEDGLSVINSSFPIVAINGKLNVSEATPHLAAIANSYKHSTKTDKNYTSKISSYLSSTLSSESLRNPSTAAIYKPTVGSAATDKSALKAQLATLSASLVQTTTQLARIKTNCEKEFIAATDPKAKAKVQKKCDETIFPLDMKQKDIAAQMKSISTALSK